MAERTCVVCGLRADEATMDKREGRSSGRIWRAWRCSDKPACDARRDAGRRRRFR